jgi:hypothetical protein
LCGLKDLCNRGAYELHTGCIDPSPRNAAQDDNFTGGACFGIDVRFAIDLLCEHGFHLRALHSRCPAQAEESATRQPVCRCLSAKGVLAGTFLRFQRLDYEKTRGETAIHASQSAQTRIGGFAGTMAMEQLSFLPSRGNRSSTGECGLDRDFVSWPYSLSRRNHPLSASGIPALRKLREGRGTHDCWSFLKDQNPGHPPASLNAC